MLIARFFLVSATLCLAVAGIAQGQTDEEELAFAKKKLDAAKKAYQTEADAFVKSIEAHFDAREATAREIANKKAVEQVKKEREAYKKWGDLPAKVERTKVVEARTRLAEAYIEASRDFLRLKMDDAVIETEKERTEFMIRSGLLVGKAKFLSSLKHTKVKTAAGEPFSNVGSFGGREAIKFRGEYVPHSLYMPPLNSEASQVSYLLAGRWSGMKAIVGVPSASDAAIARDPDSEVTFEVIGDGQSFWKSKPVSKRDEYQECVIGLDKVKVLTLKVHTAKSAAFARAVWIEPMVIEP